MKVVNRRYEADDPAVLDSYRQVVARVRQKRVGPLKHPVRPGSLTQGSAY